MAEAYFGHISVAWYTKGKAVSRFLFSTIYNLQYSGSFWWQKVFQALQMSKDISPDEDLLVQTCWLLTKWFSHYNKSNLTFLSSIFFIFSLLECLVAQLNWSPFCHIYREHPENKYICISSRTCKESCGSQYEVEDWLYLYMNDCCVLQRWSSAVLCFYSQSVKRFSVLGEQLRCSDVSALTVDLKVSATFLL